MRIKSWLMVGALCLAGSSMAGAVSRVFTIDRPAMCGNVQLTPGTYRVTTHNGRAHITNMNHYADKKPIDLAATFQKEGQRFKRTEVKTDTGGNMPRVTEIDLSRTHTALMFNQ